MKEIIGMHIQSGHRKIGGAFSMPRENVVIIERKSAELLVLLNNTLKLEVADQEYDPTKLADERITDAINLPETFERLSRESDEQTLEKYFDYDAVKAFILTKSLEKVEK